MKKILPFFGALALVLTACSSDDSNDASASIKPSRITYLDGDSQTNYFVDYKYDGNKILSETEDDGYTTKYTYTGDLITKKEEFGADKQLAYTTEYTYTNGKVSSQTMKNNVATTKNSITPDYYDKVKYTYNTDSTVSYEGFYVNASAGTEEKNGSSGVLTFQDGNLIKSVTTVSYGTTTYSYEYDAKNSPFKNVTGGSLLIDKGFEVSAHNITKYSGSSVSVDKHIISSHFSKRAGSADNKYINTFTYTYDASNFPIEQKSFDSEGALRETVKYTY